MHPELLKDLRHNVTVSIFDAAFFGMALGFASFVTIIPLFVRTFTSSAIIIGLVPAIHTVGWQLPQLFTANMTTRARQYRRLVLILTIQERLPYLGFAIVAWFSPSLRPEITLALIFLLLIWQGLGAGLTATPWQSMIGKIIPSDWLGTFFGTQSSAANLLAAITAILAGLILQELPSPLDFTLCFLLAMLGLVISWFFLRMTRESENPPAPEIPIQVFAWADWQELLSLDRNFRWFLLTRMMTTIASMGFAFYSVFAVHQLGMSEISVGILTSVLLVTQLLANPIMGWFGDRWSHRGMLVVGIAASALSGLLAWAANGSGWFFPVVILAGISNVATWTISMAMVQEFGTISQRPTYIGLSNTLIAPFTILAPFLGGWLADTFSYDTTFLVSGILSLLTMGLLIWMVKDPRRINTTSDQFQLDNIEGI